MYKTDKDYILAVRNVNGRGLVRVGEINRIINNKGSMEVLYIIYNVGLSGVKITDIKNMITITDGALYPTLAKLKKEGLVVYNSYFRLYKITTKGIKLYNDIGDLFKGKFKGV